MGEGGEAGETYYTHTHILSSTRTKKHKKTTKQSAPINYTQRALDEASDRLYYVYQTLADVDAELLADEDGAGPATHRLQVQPSIITGGVLREYQMQGLNWLIHLYDNGINGILADEMVREREEGGVKCVGVCRRHPKQPLHLPYNTKHNQPTNS